MKTNKSETIAYRLMTRALIDVCGGNVRGANRAVRRAMEEVHPCLPPRAFERTVAALCGETASTTRGGGASNEPLIPVFCSGQRWSGASAVHDYLRQFSGFSTYKKAPKFVKGGGSGVTLQKIERALRKRERVVQELLFGFFSKNVIGVDLEQREGYGCEVDVSRSFSAKLKAAEAIIDVDRSLSNFVASCFDQMEKKHEKDRKIPVSPLSEFLATVFKACSSPGSRFFLLDSVIRSYDADYLSLFPTARMIAVIRDPRDAYVTNVEKGSFSPDPEAFSREIIERIERLNKACALEGIGERILVVKFEHLVLDEATRSGILTWLGVRERDKRIMSRTFFPEQSRKNIGVHMKYREQSEIAQIEQSLPSYCVTLT